MSFSLAQILKFESTWLTFLALGAFTALVLHLFTVPASLRRLPKVPIVPLLWSYVSGKVEDSRIKRIIIPFSKQKGEDIVVVYAFGLRIVYDLDHKASLSNTTGYLSLTTFSILIAKDLAEDINMWPKEDPPSASRI